MLQLEADFANKWSLEVQFWTISEDNREDAILPEYDFSKSIGPSSCQINVEVVATETGHESCWATLSF